MTEQDLWQYQDAVKKVKRLKEKIEELNAVLTSPSGCAFSPVPSDRGTAYSPDKLSPVIETLNTYEKELDKAMNEACEKVRILDFVETILTPIEVEYLNAHYRLGIRGWYDLEKAINRSKVTQLRIRKSILEKIRNL